MRWENGFVRTYLCDQKLREPHLIAMSRPILHPPASQLVCPCPVLNMRPDIQFVWFTIIWKKSKCLIYFEHGFHQWYLIHHFGVYTVHYEYCFYLFHFDDANLSAESGNLWISYSLRLYPIWCCSAGNDGDVLSIKTEIQSKFQYPCPNCRKTPSRWWYPLSSQSSRVS